MWWRGCWTAGHGAGLAGDVETRKLLRGEGKKGVTGTR